MKILFVAMPGSIHTARWISQISSSSCGWELYLFPSLRNRFGFSIHSELNNIIIFRSFMDLKIRRSFHQKIKFLRNFFFLHAFIYAFYQCIKSRSISKFSSLIRAFELKWCIKKLKPDIIHTLETQNAGYLAIQSKYSMDKDSFPLWIHSNWGIDLDFFQNFHDHRKSIHDVLTNINCFIYEGERDKLLASKHGYDGHLFYKFPVGGGYKINDHFFSKFAKRPAERKIILLKGYQNEVRRALFALRALERCADILSNYLIVIYSAHADVVAKANILSHQKKLRTYISPTISHLEMFKLLAETRISITVNLSDGVPNSMLEAMIMGTFPIQSFTSCADEWIVDGETGFLVPPEDPEIIEIAIRRAVTDDELVNRAAKENFKICKERLDYDLLKSKTIEMYLTVAREKNSQYVT